MNGELAWFKSTYSSSSGGNCVEVAVSWRKSSYSTGEGGNCVEVAVSWRTSSHSTDWGGNCLEFAAHPHAIHIRDSKDISRPALTATPAAWAAFLSLTDR